MPEFLSGDQYVTELNCMFCVLVDIKICARLWREQLQLYLKPDESPHVPCLVLITHFQCCCDLEVCG